MNNLELAKKAFKESGEDDYLFWDEKGIIKEKEYREWIRIPMILYRKLMPKFGKNTYQQIEEADSDTMLVRFLNNNLGKDLERILKKDLIKNSVYIF